MVKTTKCDECNSPVFSSGKCKKHYNYYYSKKKCENARLRNLCASCFSDKPLFTKTRCFECREKEKDRDRQQKRTVYEHYGNKCVCCGEVEEAFLTIDHINNNGAEHRKKVHSGRFYRWIIENNYPNDLQILCHNCQWGRRKCGICPHQSS